MAVILRFREFILNTTISRAFLVATLAAVACNAHALDGLSAEVGSGNKSDFVRVGAQWNTPSRWFQSEGRHLGVYWEGTLMQIRGKAHGGRDARQGILVIGATPVFRYAADDGLGLYAEGGVGAHYFSERYDNNRRTFTSHFQFGDHIGVGYVRSDGWDIALKFQHFSNGGYKRPNPGVNFMVLKAGLRF